MSNVTVWNRRAPFAELDGFIKDVFGAATAENVVSAFRPAAEIARDGDDAVVRLELPGVDVDNDVTVELDKSRLVIRGERRDIYATEDPAQDGRTLREVRYGSFHRSFSLPNHVTGESISASYDAGVLTVRVAGAYAGTQAQRITITK